LITVAEDAHVARAPNGLSLAEAGAAPLAAVAAFAAVEALDLSQGTTVLIVSATGGVGTFATQLSVAAGAIVIAPGLPGDETYLREIGVAEVVPREGDVIGEVKRLHPDGVDAIVDLVSLMTPGTYDAALKEGGRVSSSGNSAGDGPGRTNVMATPSRENLERVAELLEDGVLTIRIQRTYALEDAASALRDLTTEHTRGKLAIAVA
jgi:NADPH:quinone reductase-like Zn-dependent oxidoreductase